MATYNHKQAAQQGGGRRRILRIGVLLGGKIIEERLVRDRSTVSIGQSSKNTFSIPLENLPREWALFEIADDAYRLRFGPRMDGRISDGAQVYTFDQVKGSRAVQQGDHWVMPLSDQARGKVTIGDLTLLFQFVTEPPMQPKPMLPASVRGTLAERIEPRLAVIVAASVVVHFGVALVAWLHDPPKERGQIQQAMQTLDVDTVDPIFEPPPEPVTDTGEKDEGAAEDKGPEPEKQPEKKPTTDKPKKPEPSGGGQPSGGRNEQDAAALQEEAARYAAALAADGESGGGIDGAMSKTAPGGDLDKQMKEVRDSNANVKVGGRGNSGTRGDGDPRTGTGTGPKLDGPGKGTIGEGTNTKTEKEPKGRIQVASKKGFDDTSLTPEAVLGKIQSAYMAGLKRCQKTLLKEDPTARARVELSFTVNSKGRTTSPRAKSDYGSLSSCIEGQMTSWTFPAPKDEDGEGTDASFQITLALQPE